MLKWIFLAVCVFTVAACSNDAPSEEQVKRALFDHYGTNSAGNELKQALGNEVSVKACHKESAGYRCQIDNKAVGSSIEMLFVFDKSDGKWKFKKEIL